MFAERLTAELRERGHEAALVTVPFKWYPGERVLERRSSGACSTSTEVDGRQVDLVIATKFPSYAVRHPRKVVWLVHQFRQAYDLDRTDLGQFGESADDRATAARGPRLDRRALGEARKLFATSQNVADRLERSTGLDAEVMLPPPQELAYRCDEYGDFVLSVGRLDRAKRVDLLLEAAAADPALRDRRRRRRARSRAARAGRARATASNGRVEFPGRVDEAELADLYARCLAVYYAPVDEDFGMVPYEAFLSEKPVVTTTDAGGPLEVVADRRTGLVRGRAPMSSREALRLAPRATGARHARGARGQGGRRARDLGRGDRRACSREGRLLLAAAARALGHRRLQRAAPAGAARAHRASTSSRRAGDEAAARADVALYHVGNDPDAHGWIVEALRRTPGRRRPARASCSTTSSPG